MHTSDLNLNQFIFDVHYTCMCLKFNYLLCKPFLNIHINLQNHEENTYQGRLNILPKSLRLLYPVRMLIQLYSLCILFWDLFWLILYSIGYILKAAKEVILPPPLKSVSNEIVMVNICIDIFIYRRLTK